jgi:hypothetical protein
MHLVSLRKTGVTARLSVGERGPPVRNLLHPLTSSPCSLPPHLLRPASASSSRPLPPLTSRHLVAAGPLRTPGSLGLQSGPRRRLRPLLRCPPPRWRPRPLRRPLEVKFSFFFKEEKEASSHMEGSTDKLPPS